MNDLGHTISDTDGERFVRIEQMLEFLTHQAAELNRLSVLTIAATKRSTDTAGAPGKKR